MPRSCGLVPFAAVTLCVAMSAADDTAAQLTGRPLDTREPITYFIATGAAETGYRRSDRQLAQWAFETWQRTSGGTIQLKSSPESEALVRLYWAGAGDGRYGEA